MCKYPQKSLTQAVLIALVLLTCGTLAGAAESNSFLSPASAIADNQRTHFFRVIGITMVAIVPVFVLLPLILLKYRRSRKSVDYRPNWDFWLPLEIVMWSIPFALVAVLSVYLWSTTHKLDPYAAIESPNPGVNIQVVGLDWKWLFIYPDLGIATVGEMAIPAEHPVAMTLTTDTVMQSFIISALAGQIYAMPGMTTKLHLMAKAPGAFEGENTQYNGNGFVHQKFVAKAMEVKDFKSWVDTVRRTGIVLDDRSYGILAVRSSLSEAHAVLATEAMPDKAIYFKVPDARFFQNIVQRYHTDKPLALDQQPGSASYNRKQEAQ